MSGFSAEMQRFLNDHPVIIHASSSGVSQNSRRRLDGPSNQTMDSGIGPWNEQTHRLPDELGCENLIVCAYLCDKIRRH
jgi:hypothetical protein